MREHDAVTEGGGVQTDSVVPKQRLRRVRIELSRCYTF